jgi:hypothetical protein
MPSRRGAAVWSIYYPSAAPVGPGPAPIYTRPHAAYIHTVLYLLPLPTAAAPRPPLHSPLPTSHRCSTHRRRLHPAPQCPLLYVRRRPVAARRSTVQPAADVLDAIALTKPDVLLHHHHHHRPRSQLPPILPATAAALHPTMPLHAARPIVRVEHGSMHTIETRNAENLFGLWSGTSPTHWRSPPQH